MSISLDADLGDAVREAAAAAGKPVSVWLGEAATRKLRTEALAAFLAAWEAEHGAFTPAELAQAELDLALPVTPREP